MTLFTVVAAEDAAEILNAGFSGSAPVILSDTCGEIDSPAETLLFLEMLESDLEGYQAASPGLPRHRRWAVPADVLNACASVREATDEDLDQTATERLRRDVREIGRLIGDFESD